MFFDVADEDDAEGLAETRRSIQRSMPLTEIACPKCEAKQSTDKLRLVTKAGFSNVGCRMCHEVTSSSIWRCRCRTPWIKCPRHVLVKKGQAKGTNGSASGRNKCRAIDRGGDVPMPLQRIRKVKSDIKNSMSQHFMVTRCMYNERRTAVNRIRLEPGSKLAARFPHLVQMAAPT